MSARRLLLLLILAALAVTRVAAGPAVRDGGREDSEPTTTVQLDEPGDRGFDPLAGFDGEALGMHLETARIEAADRIAPAVVQLRVARIQDTDFPQGQRFRTPSENPAYRQRPDGPVTGVVVAYDLADEVAWVVTSEVNVSGQLRAIEVVLADGRIFAGERMGRHEPWDIAMVRVPIPPARDEAGIPMAPVAVATPGDSAGLQVGRFVHIVGRSPGVREHTITHGIVSALERQGIGAIQIDAHLNYGNTGGPVVDLDGHLVAIATSIRPGVTHGLNSGVGFAMPWHLVETVLPTLQAGRDVARPRAPYIGFIPDRDVIGVTGIRIQRVMDGTGADRAGLRQGDVVTAIDGEPVREVSDLRRALRDLSIGDRIVLTITRTDPRGGVLTLDLPLTLGPRY